MNNLTFNNALSTAIKFGELSHLEQKSILANKAEKASLISALSLLLEQQTREQTNLLRNTAKKIRNEECGKRLILRGLVEIFKLLSKLMPLLRAKPNKHKSNPIPTFRG